MRGEARSLVAAGGLAGLFLLTVTVPGLTSQAAASSGVDMQDACRAQWAGREPTTAIVLDQYDAHSWSCESTRTRVQLSGVDVTRQCHVQYGPGTRAGLARQEDPYSWYCRH